MAKNLMQKLQERSQEQQCYCNWSATWSIKNVKRRASIAIHTTQREETEPKEQEKKNGESSMYLEEKSWSTKGFENVERISDLIAYGSQTLGEKKTKAMEKKKKNCVWFPELFFLKSQILGNFFLYAWEICVYWQFVNRRRMTLGILLNIENN